MSKGIELPNEERRQRLSGRLNDIHDAMNILPQSDGSMASETINENVTAARTALEEAEAELRDILDAMPEYDRGLVQDLVLEHATKNETTISQVDNEIVFRFAVGPVGDETELRYAVAVGGDKQWLHIDNGDDGYTEVWSN